MSIITDLVPVNVMEERDKFIVAEGNYVPHFVYRREFEVAELQAFGLPQDDERRRAHKYLADCPAKKKAKIKNPLTWEQMCQIVQELCTQLGIPLVTMVQNPHQTSRFMMDGFGRLNVRWPVKIERLGFESMLRHEVQTHFLRRFNEKQQVWGDREADETVWRRTEEGLAMINARRGMPEADIREAAILYEAASVAAESGWSEVVAALRKRASSLKKIFNLSLRVKRGLTDPQQPGGYTKDIVYWEGYWQVKEWLETPGNDPRDLYWGRVGLEELARLRPLAKTENLVYPLFLRE
ncbi:DUF1704 domain-containing protein [bacterium]|nr:DUF1704 domain-containing protein [bacterium]